MKLTRAEMCLMLSFLYETSDDEIPCGDALDGFAALAEEELRGGRVSAQTAAVAAHVALCPECAEEYASLLAAIGAASPPAGA